MKRFFLEYPIYIYTYIHYVHIIYIYIYIYIYNIYYIYKNQYFFLKNTNLKQIVRGNIIQHDKRLLDQAINLTANVHHAYLTQEHFTVNRLSLPHLLKVIKPNADLKYSTISTAKKICIFT